MPSRAARARKLERARLKTDAPAPARAGIGHRVAAYSRFYAIALIAIVLDQVSKWAVAQAIPLGTAWHAANPDSSLELIPGFLYMCHVGNKGAAFSMLQGYGILLVLLAFMALCALFLWRKSLDLKNRVMQYSFGLIVGGILGNVVDRIQLGYVVDFIDVHLGWFNYRWPAFNVADSAIFVGVFANILMSLRRPAHSSMAPADGEK